MKKIMIVLMLNVVPLCAMIPDIAQSLRRMSSVKTRRTLQGNSNFGKKHFVVGYSASVSKELATHNSIQHGENITKNSKLIKRRKSVNDSSHLLDETLLMQIFFTSTHNVRSILAHLIEGAQKSILIAAFALTDPEVANRLQKAHSAGINVEIITDFQNMNEQYSRIKDLVNQQIPVFYYRSALNPNPKQKGSRYARMHHKFLIIDQAIGVSGSANLTKSGQKDNIENIVVMRYKPTVGDLVQEFERVKKQCVACKKDGQ